jgi:hypothetical protein
MYKLIVACLLVIFLAACSTQQPYTAGDGNGNDFGPRLARTCMYSHTSKDDAIFNPTTEPPAHWHDFYGNESTKNGSTYASLMSASAKCKQDGAEGQGIDKAAWWVPNMYAGDVEINAGKLVEYDQITRDLPQSDIKPFPRGFEAVARNPQFRCGNGEFKPEMDRCTEGNFDARLDFNQCYDPNSDAVEDNLVKPLKNRCPDSHPVLLPQIQVQLTYRMPPSISGPITVAGTTGQHQDETTFHADFIHAYDTQADYVDLMTKCLKKTKQDDPRPEVCRTRDN